MASCGSDKELNLNEVYFYRAIGIDEYRFIVGSRHVFEGIEWVGPRFVNDSGVILGMDPNVIKGWVDNGKANYYRYDVIIRVKGEHGEFMPRHMIPIRYVNNKHIPIEHVSVVYDPRNIVEGSNNSFLDVLEQYAA